MPLSEHVDCAGPVPVLSLGHQVNKCKLVGGNVEFVQVPSAVT